MGCHEQNTSGWPLKQQKCIFSPFWKLEVQDCSAGRVGLSCLLGFACGPLLFTWTPGIFLFPEGHQVHPNGLVLTLSPPQRPCSWIWWHLEVLGVGGHYSAQNRSQALLSHSTRGDSFHCSATTWGQHSSSYRREAGALRSHKGPLADGPEVCSGGDTLNPEAELSWLFIQSSIGMFVNDCALLVLERAATRSRLKQFQNAGLRGLLPKCLLFFCLHPRLGLSVCLSVQGPLQGVWGVSPSPLRLSSVLFLQWCHMINLHLPRRKPLQWTWANTARIARIQRESLFEHMIVYTAPCTISPL